MGRWLRHRPGDVGLTARATTQECTQIGGNGPLGAVLGHLCTLLRRESRYESRRELRQVARAPQLPRRAGAPSLVPLAWSGRQILREWRRCQVGIFAVDRVNPHEPLKSP